MIRTPPSTPEPAALESFRRRMEGGVELLESTAARYQALEGQLKAGRWKRELRASPGRLLEAVEREAQVAELLERARKRAAADPAIAEEAGALAARIERSRTALSAAIRKRTHAEGTMADQLTALRDLVLKPPPVPLKETEVRLFDAPVTLAPRPIALSIVVAIVALLLGAGQALFPLAMVTLWLASVGRGHVWLTSERLLWQPRKGEPIEVPLQGLRPNDVRSNRLANAVWLPRFGLRLFGVEGAGRLAGLIEIWRRPALRSGLRAPRSEAPLIAVVPVLPKPAASRMSRSDKRRSGVAVLRPKLVAYWPWSAGAEVLDALSGQNDDVALPAGLLAEQLEHLSEEGLDDRLRAVARAHPEAFIWSAEETVVSFGVTPMLELIRGDRALGGYLTWDQHSAAARVLLHWPLRDRAGPT